MMDEKRPDIDNLGKFILDALQGIAYEDDAQVVSVAMKKVLDTNPPFEGRTYISFRAVNNLDTMPIISKERKRNTKAAVPGSPFESDTLWVPVPPRFQLRFQLRFRLNQELFWC